MKTKIKKPIVKNVANLITLNGFYYVTDVTLVGMLIASNHL